MSTPDPLAAIHVAVTRTELGGAGRAGSEPFLPDQAIGLDVALAAHTSGSAWLNPRDDAGVLRPGAVADLVVLDRDPFAKSQWRGDHSSHPSPLAAVGATTIRSTWIERRSRLLFVTCPVSRSPRRTTSPSTRRRRSSRSAATRSTPRWRRRPL